VEVIPRSREVGQSYLTSVLTTLRALRIAFGVVWRHRPELVSNSCCCPAAHHGAVLFLLWKHLRCSCHTACRSQLMPGLGSLQA